MNLTKFVFKKRFRDEQVRDGDELNLALTAEEDPLQKAIDDEEPGGEECHHCSRTTVWGDHNAVGLWVCGNREER